MIETLVGIAIDCIVVFGGALVLAVVLRFGRAVLDALPMSRARRALSVRVRPLVAALLIAAYAVIAARWVLASGDRQSWISFAIVVGLLAAGSWNVLRNALEGIYVRVGRSFAIGDRVEIAGVQGRVHRIGARAVVLETVDGQLAIIPYRTVATATILREPYDEQSSFHVFRVPIPAHLPIAELKRTVREAALLCHWSSTRRLPEVAAGDGGQLEITVFPVDANHVTEIEQAVHRALAEVR